jgi:phenylpropionate dioxygenase-like ring-hydroxylating dioxygenase large terminal subunit
MVLQDKALIDQWYPVSPSFQVNALPISVQVLGEKLVVFRTKQGVHAFKDLCIHRGVPLSLGKLVNDELVCAYHGWCYNSDGACSRIPSQPEGQAIPEKAKAIVYSCMELYDLIWVCLGIPSKLPININEYSDLSYKSALCGPYTLQAAGPRIIENFLDVSHLMFVHEGMLGDSGFPEILDYQVKWVEGILRSDEIQIFQPDADGRGKGVYNRYIYEVWAPLTARLKKTDRSSDDVFSLVLIVTPHTESSSTAYMIKSRNFGFDIPNEVFIQFQDRLIEQDRVIVESQQPEMLPLDLQTEMHLKSDRLSIAYRKWLRETGVTFGTA